MVTSRSGCAAVARAAHERKAGPCGGLATWSTSHAATWHISWHSVRRSLPGPSSTLLLSSMWALYLRGWVGGAGLLRSMRAARYLHGWAWRRRRRWRASRVASQRRALRAADSAAAARSART